MLNHDLEWLFSNHTKAAPQETAGAIYHITYRTNEPGPVPAVENLTLQYVKPGVSHNLKYENARPRPHKAALKQPVV